MKLPRSISLVLLGAACAFVPLRGVSADSIAAPSAFTSDELVAALTHDLASYFRLTGDFRLDTARPWTPPARTASEWDVVVTEYPAAPASTMVVRCRLLADGVPADDFAITLRGSLWRDAWFSREPISAGSVFDPAMLESRRVDSLRTRDALPATVGDDSYIVSRQVPPSRLLTWEDIARRPLVHKGEVVDVFASDGGLLVTMKALAVENGVRGDTVIVRNLETLKEISAQVVSPGRVEVRF